VLEDYFWIADFQGVLDQGVQPAQLLIHDGNNRPTLDEARKLPGRTD
jgi:hypothetical protein